MHRSNGKVLLMHRSNGKVLLICIDLRYLRDIMIFDINRSYPMRTLDTEELRYQEEPNSMIIMDCITLVIRYVYQRIHPSSTN